MKLIVTTLFITFTSLVFAQKKQIKSLEEAIENKKYVDAATILKSIDENTVEEKYQETYDYLKGATLVGNPQNSVATEEQIATAKESLNKVIAQNGKFKDQAVLLLAQANDRLFSLAKNLAKNNKLKEAATLMDIIYTDNKSNVVMLSNAAMLYYSAGELEMAKKRYEELYALNYTGVQTTYLAVDKLTEQATAFPDKQSRDLALKSPRYSKPSEEVSPSVVGDIVQNLVWLYKQEGNLDKAKSFFQEAKKKYPNDDSLKIKEADIYLILEMMEEYEKASLALTESVKDPKIYDNLALAAQKNSDWDQVIKYYTSSLALNSDNYAANVNISNAYIQKGNLESTTAEEQQELYKAAMGHLETANKMKPEDEGIKNTLIQLYQVFKMEDKAAALKGN